MVRRPLDIDFRFSLPSDSPYALRDSLASKFTYLLRRGLENHFPVACAITANPLLVFPSRTALFQRLSLDETLLSLYRKSTVLKCPPVAPERHHTDHFVQWGMVWEPLDYHTFTRAENTLALDVGGRQFMVSMMFTRCRKSELPDAMQLDQMTLHCGQKPYKINVAAGSCSATNLRNQSNASLLLVAVAECIREMKEDYDRAESILEKGCLPVLDSLEAAANVAVPQLILKN